MKKLPLVMFLLALVVAGVYVYVSHAEKASRARNVSPALKTEMLQRQQVLTKQLRAKTFHHGPLRGAETTENQQLQQELSDVSAQLKQLQAQEAAARAAPVAASITIQDRLVASVIFGLIGLIVIFGERFPSKEKKYGFGMLVTILGFWLKA